MEKSEAIAKLSFDLHIYALAYMVNTCTHACMHTHKNHSQYPKVMVHAFNPSTLEAETGKSVSKASLVSISFWLARVTQRGSHSMNKSNFEKKKTGLFPQNQSFFV